MSAYDRKQHSFLVRVWVEPEASSSGESPPVRAYVRDLSTGQEQYVANPDEIVPFLLRRLQQDEAEERRRSLGSGRDRDGA